jgi:RNA polymerase subunit RPABC4/transcription elongation factor Spt4
MNKCINCTYTTENDEKFCPNCGSELVAEAAPEVAPVVESNSTQAKPAGNSKALTAMILSAAAMLCCVPGLGSFTFNLLALLLAIVGIILANQCIKEGDTSTYSSLGKTFGKIAIIVTCIDLCITIILAIVGFLITFGTVILGFLGTTFTAAIPLLSMIFMTASG